MGTRIFRQPLAAVLLAAVLLAAVLAACAPRGQSGAGQPTPVVPTAGSQPGGIL